MPPLRVLPRNVTGQNLSSSHFRPAGNIHGTDWHENTDAIKLNINGIITEQDFAIEYPIGETITRGSDKNVNQSRFFCLYCCFTKYILIEFQH